jgi:endonuclease/exonuclease/phosphatase (EEP) superfamily protein YafD
MTEMSVDADEKGADEKSVARARFRPAARLMTALCWLAVAPGIGWAVVRVGGLERAPLVQLLAFTPYAAAWAPVPLVLALALRRWSVAALAALATLALVGVVAPRAMPGDRPATAGQTMRVLTANLLAGAGDPATVLALVRAHQVDVLAMQEFTPASQAELDRLGVADCCRTASSTPR